LSLALGVKHLDWGSPAEFTAWRTDFEMWPPRYLRSSRWRRCE